MKRVGLALTLAAALSSAATAAPRSSLTPGDLAPLAFAGQPGTPLPLGLAFRDEPGMSVGLGRFFHGAPVLLVLDYLHCPSLCGLVLGGLASSLDALPGRAGRDYEVLAISIDPGETPSDARDAKASYITRFGAVDGVAGWHFLTGDEAAIRRLADAVGFRFRYDPAIGQFAHPAGVAVVTPSGVLSTVIPGIDAPPQALQEALAAAGEDRAEPSHSDPPLQFLCFGYDPQSGRWTVLVERLTAAASLATALALVGGIALALRRERRGAT